MPGTSVNMVVQVAEIGHIVVPSTPASFGGADIAQGHQLGFRMPRDHIGMPLADVAAAHHSEFDLHWLRERWHGSVRDCVITRPSSSE